MTSQLTSHIEADARVLLAKLRKFRDSLPSDQRKDFARLFGGASAAAPLLKNLSTSEPSTFSKSLGKFANNLPAPEKQILTLAAVASALAWVGASQAGAVEQTKVDQDQRQPGVIYFEELLHLVPIAVIVVGVYLVGDALIEDEEEPIIPPFVWPPDTFP